jgi:hypothetical protein
MRPCDWVSKSHDKLGDDASRDGPTGLVRRPFPSTARPREAANIPIATPSLNISTPTPKQAAAASIPSGGADAYDGNRSAGWIPRPGTPARGRPRGNKMYSPPFAKRGNQPSRPRACLALLEHEGYPEANRATASAGSARSAFASRTTAEPVDVPTPRRRRKGVRGPLGQAKSRSLIKGQANSTKWRCLLACSAL